MEVKMEIEVSFFSDSSVALSFCCKNPDDERALDQFRYTLISQNPSQQKILQITEHKQRKNTFLLVRLG